MTHKSRPDCDNQELGTTKAHKGKKDNYPRTCTGVPLILKPECGDSFSRSLLRFARKTPVRFDAHRTKGSTGYVPGPSIKALVACKTGRRVAA
jgi:hypothetical protein